MMKVFALRLFTFFCWDHLHLRLCSYLQTVYIKRVGYFNI